MGKADVEAVCVIVTVKEGDGKGHVGVWVHGCIYCSGDDDSQL